MKDAATERKEKILAEYDDRYQTFVAFKCELAQILERILSQHPKSFHAVQARVKKRDSLEKKLGKPEYSSYRNLDQIIDICGLRVITYFANDVPEIFGVIERELEVVKSGDKADVLNPDQFGYLSFHCVVTLPPRRSSLTENRPYLGMKAEIQIRSILQHAWAEIEHDLGYKNEQIKSVPKHIRRPFSCLAGLLELGDAEFERIRREVKAYEQEIERERLDSRTPIAVDKNSLAAFVKRSVISQKIDSSVFKKTQLRVVFSETFVDAYVPRLEFVAITTIGELERKLKKKGAFLERFITAWFLSPAANNASLIPAGIGISFLCWTMALEKGGFPALDNFLTKHAFNKTRNPKQTCIDLCDAYNKAKQK